MASIGSQSYIYEYGELGTNALEKLWKLLGTKQWPEEIYKNFGSYFEINGINYKK